MDSGFKEYSWTKLRGDRWEKGIGIEVRWFDESFLEVSFSCSNGRFSGQAEIYLAHDTLSTLADALIGFPANPNDSCKSKLGTFKPEHADGGVRMYSHCMDSVGHAAVDIQLRGDACTELGEIESVALRIPIQAASVDSFIKELRMIDKTIGATAYLQMAR